METELLIKTSSIGLKTIFVGEDISFYELLSSIIEDTLMLEQNQQISEEELTTYDVVFVDKKSFYKYYQVFKKIKEKKSLFFVFLLNDGTKLTAQEIDNLKQYAVRDAFNLPEQTEQLKKTWSFVQRVKDRKNHDKKVLHYHIKPNLPKRIFDIVFSFSVLLLLSPFLLFIICLIKITSKGPLFYASKRVGNGYRIFDFYKFRTMRVDADKMIDQMQKLNQYAAETPKKEIQLTQLCSYCQEKGECQEKLYNDEMVICETAFVEEQLSGQEKAFLKVKNDPRITPIGHFLRQSSIDELPQLFNVLKGDMSLVGNRPLPLYEAENLTTDADAERFLAPAGLTGLWQVMKRGQGKMSATERKELDNQYARNQSFGGDILLLLKTIPALFQKEDV